MSIQYAILGLLSWRPLSGYDLKKVFADSDVLYWSGNNNQIYKALVQLHEEGLVTQEIQIQDTLPAKKIYSITEKGFEALKAWVLSVPELPEFHDAFLVQLSWADLLDNSEIEKMLANYEEEVRVQILMLKEKANRKETMPARTRREDYIWKMISQNIISQYENELDWVRKVREGLQQI
jgi:PadR family transcriptional regulator, regulatory protein AphA